jgi:hypothetical protein
MIAGDGCRDEQVEVGAPAQPFPPLHRRAQLFFIGEFP